MREVGKEGMGRERRGGRDGEGEIGERDGEGEMGRERW